MTASPLPLRLPAAPRDGAENTYRLSWLIPDRAFVLRYEPLCEAVPEVGRKPKPLRLFSPAPGQIHQIAPTAGGLKPATLVGKLVCGTALEGILRPRAEAVLNELRAHRTLNSDGQRTSVRSACLTRQLLSLQADLGRLRRRFPPGQPPAAGSGVASAASRAAAALLDALADSGKPESSRLTAEDCRILFEVLRALTGSIATAEGREPARFSGKQALSALERLYDARIAEYREAIADLPLELQEAKLRLWQDLKEHRLRGREAAEG